MKPWRTRSSELTGSKSTKKHLSYEEAYGRPFDDMQRRVPCLDRIKAAVGYQPKTSLTETLQAVIAEEAGPPRAAILAGGRSSRGPPQDDDHQAPQW